VKMEERLHKRVIGQEEALKASSDAVRLAWAGLREGRRPTGTFLFLRQTGVGKMELAKALAETVSGEEDATRQVREGAPGRRLRSAAGRGHSTTEHPRASTTQVVS